MKQSLKMASLAGALTLALAFPASAASPLSDFERDMALAFENDGEPLELALLSEQEMAETQGAVWPFKVPWIGRIFWGSSYVWVQSGFNVYERGDFTEIRTMYRLMGIELMAYGLIGLVSVHPGIGLFLGFGADKSFRSLRQAMRDNGWNIFDVINHANDLLNKKIEGLLRGGEGSEAMSASLGQSDASRYLVGLLTTFPQDRLRKFLSDIPRKSFNRVLKNVAPGTTRADFLDNLPVENVSDFLAAMPEEYMPEFKSIVPPHLMNRITTATTALANNRESLHSGHWRY